MTIKSCLNLKKKYWYCKLFSIMSASIFFFLTEHLCSIWCRKTRWLTHGISTRLNKQTQTWKPIDLTVDICHAICRAIGEGKEKGWKEVRNSSQNKGRGWADVGNNYWGDLREGWRAGELMKSRKHRRGSKKQSDCWIDQGWNGKGMDKEAQNGCRIEMMDGKELLGGGAWRGMAVFGNSLICHSI